MRKGSGTRRVLWLFTVLVGGAVRGFAADPLISVPCLSSEGTDGKRLGAFSVPDEAWGYHAALLGSTKLYLDNCKSVRIVDFDGKTQLEIRPRDVFDEGSRWGTDASVCDQGGKSSADGGRMLFDFASHRVFGLQRFRDGIEAITSLGMAGPEDVNREDVRVVDTAQGNRALAGTAVFQQPMRG